MKRKGKMNLPGIIMVFSLLLTFGSYPAVAHSAGGEWKTFKSKNGWSIQHPPDWQFIQKYKVDEEPVLTLMGPSENRTGTSEWVALAYLGCSSMLCSSNSSPIDVRIQSETSGSLKKVIKNKKKTLDGRSAHEVTVEEKMGEGHTETSITIYVQANDRDYRFRYSEIGTQANASIRGPSDWKFYKTFQKMMETLRFFKTDFRPTLAPLGSGESPALEKK